jgi:hypothetical protein
MGKDEEKKECAYTPAASRAESLTSNHSPFCVFAVSGPDTRVGWVQAKLQKAFENMKGDKFTKAFNEPEAT